MFGTDTYDCSTLRAVRGHSRSILSLTCQGFFITAVVFSVARCAGNVQLWATWQAILMPKRCSCVTRRSIRCSIINECAFSMVSMIRASAYRLLTQTSSSAYAASICIAQESQRLFSSVAEDVNVAKQLSSGQRRRSQSAFLHQEGKLIRGRLRRLTIL